MKLQKRFMMIFSILVFALVLVACNKSKLTSIEITGIADIEVASGAEFNALTGVKATGDDGVDYTDKITITSTSSQLNRETGAIDTSVPGEVKVRYEVRVGEGDNLVLAQPWRTITVLRPPRGEELIQQGIAYWEKYENAGGTINLTEDAEGTLELVITSGEQTHEPRINQMEIPFEKGKTYRVSFDAKALEEKAVNLQAGELLDVAPWFTEFHKGQREIRTITTDWKSFEFFFKHTIDNDRGGVIFEFGPIAGKAVDTTVWLKNIDVQEAEEQADEIAPLIEGAADGFVQLGSTFDPLAGVTAADNIDGDVTDKIQIVSIKKDDVEVTEVDTTVEGTVYVITYKVTDAAGNESEEVIRTITIKDFEAEFGNVLVNGDFSDGTTGWITHTDNSTIDFTVENEEAVLNITNVGINPWDVQISQNKLTFEKNNTYKLRFTARAESARKMNMAIGKELTADPWIIFYTPKVEGIELTTTNQTFTYTFRVEEDSTTDGKLGFELGNIEAALAGKVFISDVTLEKVLFIDDFTKEGYLMGEETVHGHVIENVGGEHATGEREENKLTITVATIGADAYIPHYYYMIPRLIAGTYTFKVDITSNVSRGLRFNAILPHADYISILEGGQNDFNVVSGEKLAFEVTFTITEALDFVKLELDFGNLGEGFVSEAGVFVLENISLTRE